MKKRKLLALGLIALVLAGGLALVSCGKKCPGGGSSGGKGECTNKKTIGTTIPGNLNSPSTRPREVGDFSNYKDCKDGCIKIQIGSGGTYNDNGTIPPTVYTNSVYNCTCE